jgi:hypothetical protein
MFYSILRERVIVRARGGCWRIYFSVIFSIGVARVNGAQRELFMPLFLKEIGEQRIFFHCLFAQILSTELSCQKL